MRWGADRSARKFRQRRNFTRTAGAGVVSKVIE
jgi:hypothetical protein